jgi:hypothetical protein
MKTTHVSYTAGVSEEPADFAEVVGRCAEAMQQKLIKVQRDQDDQPFVIFEGHAIALSADKAGMLTMEYMGTQVL